MLQNIILNGLDFFLVEDQKFYINRIAPDLTQYNYHQNKYPYSELMTHGPDYKVCVILIFLYYYHYYYYFVFFFHH